MTTTRGTMYTLLVMLAVTFLLPTESVALPRRGFMLATYEADIAKTQREINEIAEKGGNLVRFPVYFSNTSCNVQCWLNYAEAAHTVANQRGVLFVIDFHHPSSTSGNSSITDENDFVAKWAMFAQRFVNKPRIWYDLCNEPNHPEWARVALRAAREIRKYDIHTAIVYAPQGSTTRPASGSDFKPLSGISNQIIEFHFWDWYSTVQNNNYGISANYRYVGSAGSASATSYTLAQLQAKLENVRRFGAEYGVPVYMGEVGIYQGHRDAARFFRDFTNECDNKGIHLTVHAFREADVWNYELNADAWRILSAWLFRR